MMFPEYDRITVAVGPQADRLNTRVELLLAGKSPFTKEEQVMGSDEMQMLKMAARLSSLRPYGSQPVPAFVASLRRHVLDEAGR